MAIDILPYVSDSFSPSFSVSSNCYPSSFGILLELLLYLVGIIKEIGSKKL